MLCRHCNAEIPDSSRICSKCGKEQAGFTLSMQGWHSEEHKIINFVRRYRQIVMLVSAFLSLICVFLPFATSKIRLFESSNWVNYISMLRADTEHYVARNMKIALLVMIGVAILFMIVLFFRLFKNANAISNIIINSVAVICFAAVGIIHVVIIPMMVSGFTGLGLTYGFWLMMLFSVIPLVLGVVFYNRKESREVSPLLEYLKKKLRPKKVNRSFGGNVAIFLVLAFMGIFMVFPLVYVVMNSLKPLNELFLFPPRFFVNKPTGQNFIDLFNLISDSWIPFSRYIFNTVFVTAVGTVGHVLLASMAAYVLAKHKFFGSKLIFKVIVISLMFTGAVTQVPNYQTMSNLGFIDSYWSLILPALASSLGLYLMKQFMEQVNDSILESARIDGAGEFRIYWSIVMPYAKPAWITLVILQVQGLWGIASAYIYSEDLKSLSQAMGQIVSGGIARAGAAGAAGVVMLVVPITVFIMSQSKVVETMGSSGIKE